LLDQPFYGWVQREKQRVSGVHAAFSEGLLDQPFYGWVVG